MAKSKGFTRWVPLRQNLSNCAKRSFHPCCTSNPVVRASLRFFASLRLAWTASPGRPTEDNAQKKRPALSQPSNRLYSLNSVNHFPNNIFNKIASRTNSIRIKLIIINISQRTKDKALSLRINYPKFTIKQHTMRAKSSFY